MITSMTVVDKIIGSAPFVCEGDPVTGIAHASQLGYDGVELHFTDPSGVDADAIAAALSEHNMVLTAIGTGRAYVNEGLSISDPDEQIRRKAVARLEDFLELAGRFGAKIIIGCMRGNIRCAEELPAALDRLARSMAHLDKVAGEKHVTIVFEPINRYENNFLCTMHEISDFIRSNNLQHTGMLVDTFHMNIEEGDLAQTILDCASEIHYVHLADSNRRYPGQGHTDLRTVLCTLREVGYTGVLSAEVLPWPSKEEAAARWLTCTKQLLSEIL